MTEVVETHQQGILEEWSTRGKILAEGARVGARWPPSICKMPTLLVSNGVTVSWNEREIGGTQDDEDHLYLAELGNFHCMLAVIEWERNKEDH